FARVLLKGALGCFARSCDQRVAAGGEPLWLSARRPGPGVLRPGPRRADADCDDNGPADAERPLRRAEADFALGGRPAPAVAFLRSSRPMTWRSPCLGPHSSGLPATCPAQKGLKPLFSAGAFTEYLLPMLESAKLR